MKQSDFYTEFKNPSSKYRSLPFWAWNDKLDKNELIRQIREMKEAGIGGFFMHSRDGLETEYMSEEWLECIKTAVEEAKANDMYAWLYDEDRWPSGSCAGRNTSDGIRGCKGLTLEVCTGEITDTDKILALYAAEIDEMDIYSLRRISNFRETKQNETLLIARLEISAPSEWFNFGAPPDNLSFDEVQEFISSTHNRYRDCIGSEFGKSVPGIFTDEPGLADRHAAFNPNRGWIPWTVGFDEYYKSKRGADVFDTLPYIYFNHKKSRKARHDYWRTISERFFEAYSLQISGWCKENGLAYTGHFLQEDKLGLCCRVSGSIMPHYAVQDVPAIDLLTERTEEYLTVKQCVSVANQLGKETILSEMYGCTGWDFSFEGQKRIGEWQYVLGINGRCQHLALYSLRGCRKRDYPPSINCNAPWWKHYKIVEDYFARLGYVLRQGKAVRNVLIIHPMSTVWSNMGCNPYGNPVRKEERDIPMMNKLGDRLNELIKNLCHRHYDCDLGDETIIAQYGNCNDRKFNIGKCSYDTVIVPYCETLMKSTVNLLMDFMNNGGTVLGIEPLTSFVEGERIEIAEKLKNHTNFVALDCEEKLYGYIKPIVSLANKTGHENEDVLCQLRKDNDGYILYIVNSSHNKGHEIKIDAAVDGRVYKLNCIDGEINKFSDMAEFNVYLPPCGSELFYITDNITECDDYREVCGTGIVSLAPTSYRTDTENVLTLDRCRYYLDGEDMGEDEIWKAQYKIRKKLNMRQINLNGIEQRYRWANQGHENNGHELIMEIPFVSRCEVNEAQLVIERPECFEISLDDMAIKNEECGYFFDKSFKRINLPRISKGKHTLTLKCRYTNDMELECCYIIGDFGVNKKRELTEKPEQIKMGDITKQGFYHYAGGVEYLFEYKAGKPYSAYLDIQDFKGICAVIAVNGTETVVPWSSIIETELQQGHNEIAVKVCVGLRNMLGPHHIKSKPTVTKDSCFCAKGDNYTSEYITAEAGLYSKPKLIFINNKEKKHGNT